MLKEFLTHRLAYICLILALICFTLTFSYVWTNKEAMQVVIYIMMAFYILWGVSVHTKANHVTAKIVLEYVAVAALAGACLHVLLL